MNKYQEALDELNGYGENGFGIYYDLLQELVDKTTPMKTINKTGRKFEHDVNPVHCPTCDAFLYESVPHCQGCGQALDWSE